MRTLILVNAFLAFLIAPFISLYMVSKDFETITKPMILPTVELNKKFSEIKNESSHVGRRASDILLLANKQGQAYEQQASKLTVLSKQSLSQKKLSDDIYEKKILDMLGPAIAAHISNRIEVKIFELDELGYRGYIAKVKLFDPTAFKVSVAKDELGKLETTSEAAKRNNAIIAVNGGGFYTESRDGKSYAQLIGNTVINGMLVEPFNAYPGDLFFAGINRQGRVIGTIPQTEKELMNLQPYQGVSFIPILLKDGYLSEIPDKWKKTRQPRTLIGRYANNDLILIVVDGRQNDWSVGVSLERLQEKLLELGVKDAYNLDGGGSSAMYYNGELLNRPSDGQQRPVVNNILIQP